jgi:phosphoglycolate phosphatase
MASLCAATIPGPEVVFRDIITSTMSALHHIELVICDCDGTLADSLGAITETFHQVLAARGLPQIDREVVGRYVGLPLESLFHDLLPELSPEAKHALRLEYKRLYPGIAAGRTPLFAGVRAALATIHDRGLRLAMATGKSLAGVRRFLAEEGLEETFEAVRCADTAARPKPYRDMVEEILLETGVEPHAAVMVGDTPFDIQMGRDAGVVTCGVASGGFTAAELAVHGPTLLLPRFTDLVDRLPCRS